MADRASIRKTRTQTHYVAFTKEACTPQRPRRKKVPPSSISRPCRLPLPHTFQTSQSQTQPRQLLALPAEASSKSQYHFRAAAGIVSHPPSAAGPSNIASPIVPSRPITVPGPAYQKDNTATATTISNRDIDILTRSPNYANAGLPHTHTHTHQLNSIASSTLRSEELDFDSSGYHLLSPLPHLGVGTQKQWLSSFPNLATTTTSISPPSSISGSTSLSFVTVENTPGSVVTEDLPADLNHGGFVMVSHKRAYSDQSVGSNGSGDKGPAFGSSPDEKEWMERRGEAWIGGSGVQRRDLEGDVEMEVEGEEVNDLGYDARSVLPRLGNNEPRAIDNSYQYQQLSSAGYHNTPPVSQAPSYNYESVNPNLFIRSTTPAKVSSDGPWIPVAPQVSNYESGYVAFMPSPGSAGERDSDTSRSRASSASKSPQSGKSSVQKSNPKSKKASNKGKEKDVHAWEHAVASKGGLQFVTENVKDAVDMRNGIRKGKLDPETAEKARRIRRMKACWNCWIQKVPCSEEKVCERCTKLFSPIADQLCCRTGFKDYESTLFPEFLHAHFKKQKIEDLISEHTSGFSNTVLVVEVTTGELFKPMTLTANVFKPTTRELLRHASLVSQPGQDSQLVERYSAPVGILALSQSEMKKLCTEHVDEMVANLSYAAQATAGDSAEIPYEILEIVRKYCAKKDVPIVQNALRLHAIHYFMGTLITFSSESAAAVSRSIRNYDALLEPYLSSRLLNRQIKYIMHKLHREVTIEVLEGLERSLRTRTKDSWGPSFCTILILCLCIEDLQIAADTMVVCDMLKKGTDSLFTRDQSYRVCVALDEFPFLQCKRLFHDIYKSHKEVQSGARDGGFNPLRCIQDTIGTGLDGATDELARAIYSLMESTHDEMVELSQRVATISFEYTVKPKDIKTNNTGRLASDFLRSFFPESPVLS